MIKHDRLARTRGDFAAIDNVSFPIKKGEILSLLQLFISSADVRPVSMPALSRWAYLND